MEVHHSYERSFSELKKNTEYLVKKVWHWSPDDERHTDRCLSPSEKIWILGNIWDLKERSMMRINNRHLTGTINYQVVWQNFCLHGHMHLNSKRWISPHHQAVSDTENSPGKVWGSFSRDLISLHKQLFAPTLDDGTQYEDSVGEEEMGRIKLDLSLLFL